MQIFKSSGTLITLSQTRVPDLEKGGSRVTRTCSLGRPVARRTDSLRQPLPINTGRRTRQTGCFLTISFGYSKSKIPKFGLKRVRNVSLNHGPAGSIGYGVSEKFRRLICSFFVSNPCEPLCKSLFTQHHSPTNSIVGQAHACFHPTSTRIVSLPQKLVHNWDER